MPQQLAEYVGLSDVFAILLVWFYFKRGKTSFSEFIRELVEVPARIYASGRIESINAFTTSQSYEDAAMPRLNSSHASEDFIFGVGSDTSDIAGPH